MLRTNQLRPSTGVVQLAKRPHLTSGKIPQTAQARSIQQNAWRLLHHTAISVALTAAHKQLRHAALQAAQRRPAAKNRRRCCRALHSHSESHTRGRPQTRS
mmetsp:Transcript_6332/g.18198  ORF Transcript_6332/g.18198 Transcript_6332/m.18198 type:complete len:101 (+) Transcript_6332:1495-1797(+)